MCGVCENSFGAIAQLVEHLLCTQGVVGSTPTGSIEVTASGVCSSVG